MKKDTLAFIIGFNRHIHLHNGRQIPAEEFEKLLGSRKWVVVHSDGMSINYKEI